MITFTKTYGIFFLLTISNRVDQFQHVLQCNIGRSVMHMATSLKRRKIPRYLTGYLKTKCHSVGYRYQTDQAAKCILLHSSPSLLKKFIQLQYVPIHVINLSVLNTEYNLTLLFFNLSHCILSSLCYMLHLKLYRLVSAFCIKPITYSIQQLAMLCNKTASNCGNGFEDWLFGQYYSLMKYLHQST